MERTRPRRRWRTQRLIMASVLSGLAMFMSVESGPSAYAHQPLDTVRQPTSSAAARTTSVRTFLIAIGDNGRTGTRIGCGDSLVPVIRRIAPTIAPLTAAMKLLLNDHHRYYGQSGLYNALYQSRLQVQRASVVQGTAVVHLKGTMQLGGVCDDPRVGAQLRQTVRQFPTVRRVEIFINGIPLWKRLSEK
jgi:hypothetical protein